MANEERSLNIPRESEEMRIVLIGGGGSGKSATGNTILRKMAFATRTSQDPTTLSCQAERVEFEGTPVLVVDTPWNIGGNTTEIHKCFTSCAPGPHAFLLVIPLKRFTDVEQQMKRMFGDKALRYVIALFTGGDELPDGVTAEQFIRQLPVSCGGGYHVFNNRDEDPSQVRELLKKINTMVENNGGSFYTKVKDWKQKYVYPMATAVTVGVGVGGASGGSGVGVLVAAAGSAVGAAAAAAGGNKYVAVAAASAVGLAFLITVGLAVASAVIVTARVIGAGAVVGAAVGAAALVPLYEDSPGVMFGALAAVLAAVLTAFVAFLAFILDYRNTEGADVEDLIVYFAVQCKTVFFFCARIVAKAAAGILAGAGTHRDAFYAFDFINGRVQLITGVIGGAAIGAGVTAADYLFCAHFAASVGVIVVLHSLCRIFCEAFKCNMIGEVAIAAEVSVGAAFGAAVGVFGASRFGAGVQ